jgi:arylsulfatase A-like enzyme
MSPRPRQEGADPARRLATLATATGVAAAAIALAVFGPRVSGKRPPSAGLNVVLIVLDTLRADHLGAYGHEGTTTPRLDAFARESYVFENALSSAPWTRTALASLFTSLHPFDHGVYSESREDRLAADVPLIQDVLRERVAYSEAIVTQPHYLAGLDRGFDAFELRGNQSAAKVYDRAIRFLDEHGDDSFFLLVHNLDPHDFYEHREGFSERPATSTLRTTRDLMPAQRDESGILFDSPENHVTRLSPAELEELVDNYDGEIRYLDHHLGRFLDALDARGLADRTLVIVTADHGEEFFDHGSWWHGGSLHGELLHVPLMIRVPGHAARRIDATVGLVDVLPTLAELMEVDPPPGIRGRSLVPLMRGEPLDPAPLRSANGFRRRRVQQAVVFDDHKLIRFADGEFIGLYDLAADPEERVNLGPEHPDRARLEALLPPPGPVRRRDPRPLEVDAETREALRALGYATSDEGGE